MKPTKKATAMLIYSNDPNEIYFECGKAGLYVHKMRMMVEYPSKINPYYVIVKTDNEKNLTKFIEKTDLQAIRLFKTCVHSKKYKKPPTKFVYSTSRNLVGLLNGKTIRVRSTDKDLQDLFYKVLTEINKEFSYGCKFDFDKFDVTFVIKEIKTKNKRVIATFFYGKKYPNKKE